MGSSDLDGSFLCDNAAVMVEHEVEKTSRLRALGIVPSWTIPDVQLNGELERERDDRSNVRACELVEDGMQKPEMYSSTAT